MSVCIGTCSIRNVFDVCMSAHLSSMLRDKLSTSSSCVLITPLTSIILNS